MYCKHCGKQIADDSKFCQHCGRSKEDTTALNQAQSILKNKSEEKVVEIPTIKANFSEKTKWWIVGCGVWTVLNLYWLFAGDKYSSASEYFMPFYTDGLDSNGSYYDISEFIVYVIGLPFIVWGLVLLNRKLNSDSEEKTSSTASSSSTDANKSNEESNINDALGL